MIPVNFSQKKHPDQPPHPLSNIQFVRAQNLRQFISQTRKLPEQANIQFAGRVRTYSQMRNGLTATGPLSDVQST